MPLGVKLHVFDISSLRSLFHRLNSSAHAGLFFFRRRIGLSLFAARAPAFDGAVRSRF
jgi:hypothetical protein